MVQQPDTIVHSTSATGNRRESPDPPPAVPCQHLHGEIYTEYVLRTQTRTLGGISPTWRGRTARQLFQYKPFLPLHGEPVTEPANAHPEAPEDGNIECEERKWTLKEQLALDHALACWARWTVDFGRRTVKSTKCEGTTMDKSGVCDACRKLAKKDAGFKKAIARVRVCRVPCWTSVMAYMQFVEEKGVQATRRCAMAQVCAEREVCAWNPPSG